MTNTYPPGPRGPILLGSILEFMSDAPTFIKKVAQYGDLPHFRMGPLHAYLLNRADYVYEVMVKQANNFHKDDLTKHVGGKFTGVGLVLRDGEDHRKQRKLMQPAFHHKRIESYMQIMVDYTQKMLNRWQVNNRINVEHEMMALTLAIVSKALFNAEVEDETNIVAEAMAIFQRTVGLELRGGIVIPDWLPIKHKREMKWAIHTLDTIVRQIIAERRRSDEDKGDLLSMLMLATTDESGRMSDDDLRDEVVTLFMAGHETTASLLTWVLYSLASHPDVVQRLRQEVDATLTGDTITLSDLANLTYADLILKETARLYPPFWLTSRAPVEDFTLDGYTIPKGSMVFISPYLLHHDPRYFEDPESFLPERFANDYEKQIPRLAYFPFGAGPRVCIGQQFGWMEAKVALAMIVKNFDLHLESPEDVEVLGRVTLHPRNPMFMTASKREVPVPAAALVD